MAYCTQADLDEVLTNAELISLTDDEGINNINSDRIDDAIARADALIDGYCRAQHTVPFSTVPAMVKDLSIFFTGYYLWKRRRKGQLDDEREESYRRNRDTLRDISSGKIKLEDTAAFANTGEIFYSNKDICFPEFFKELPCEIIDYYILPRLSVEDLLNLRLVDTFFYDFLEDSDIFQIIVQR